MQENMAVMQQNMIVMQQNMTVMQQNMTAMQQNINAIREDSIDIRRRVDSIEGTVRIAIRESLGSFGMYLDDLNIEVSSNQRQIRLLRRRVRRLEGSEDE